MSHYLELKKGGAYFLLISSYFEYFNVHMVEVAFNISLFIGFFASDEFHMHAEFIFFKKKRSRQTGLNWISSFFSHFRLVSY